MGEKGMTMRRNWARFGIVFVVGVLVTACAGGGAPQIKNAQLQVGDKAPDFRLPDHTGGYVRLSDYQGKSNVIIAFYPAAFTPV